MIYGQMTTSLAFVCDCSYLVAHELEPNKLYCDKLTCSRLVHKRDIEVYRFESAH